METKEEKVVAPTNSEEEKEFIKDVDLGLTKADVKEVKKKTKKEVLKQHVLNEDQEKLFQEMLENAGMPVEMHDTDFKLGKQELDIRYLNRHNQTQMMFRQLTLQNVYLKQALTSLIDLTRLTMVIADKLGVPDIIQATDDIIEKIEKANKIKEQLKRKERVDEIKEQADKDKVSA